MDRFAEIKAFCLVAGSGGFSAAARQLGVATSSVTRLVDALERRVGAPLLNRSTRSVTMTDAGRAYFERAGQILSELEDADDAVAAGGGEARGLLRVAAPVTFATMYIAPLLAELARRHPGLALDLHLSDAVANFVDASIDVAIRIGSDVAQPNLVARRLVPHRRYVCGSADYLARHGVPRAPSDLAAHNCLQFTYHTGRHSWNFRSAQGLEQVAVRGTISANNADVLRQAAIGGVGLALLADWLVQRDVDSGALVRVLADYDANPGAMDVAIYAMYPANRRGSAKLKAFVDLLAEALAAA